MRTLRIGFLSTLYHTSHIIREERWLEGELGVRARWSLFGTGPEMVAAFSRGELDLGYMGLPPAVIGIARGAPLVCIAGGHVEGTVVLAREGYAGLEERGTVASVVEGFEGSRVGIPAAGSIHDVIFRDLVMRHRAPGIRILNYAWADLIPHAAGRAEIDIAVGTPALAVLCVRECGMRVVLPAGTLWAFNPSYGILAQRGLLQAGSLLEGFLVLHEKACNLLREDPERAARIVVKALPWLDEGFVLEVLRVSPRYCASLPEAYIRSTLAFLPVLERLGYLDPGRRIEPERIFDTRFICKAHPGSHHY